MLAALLCRHPVHCYAATCVVNAAQLPARRNPREYADRPVCNRRRWQRQRVDDQPRMRDDEQHRLHADGDGVDEPCGRGQPDDYAGGGAGGEQHRGDEADQLAAT